LISLLLSDTKMCRFYS